jgi:hypothetical protein
MRLLVRLLIGVQWGALSFLLLPRAPVLFLVAFVGLALTYWLLEESWRPVPWVRPPDGHCLCLAPRPWMCPVHAPESVYPNRH